MITNLLGVAFLVTLTNFHHQNIEPVKCPIKINGTNCPITHHYRIIDVSHVTTEKHAHVVIDGNPAEIVIEAIPTHAVAVTNYVSDLNAVQRRGRVAPLPILPPVTVLTNTAPDPWLHALTNGTLKIIYDTNSPAYTPTTKAGNMHR